MGKRKAIQIASVNNGRNEFKLYVLCDDGTLWFLESVKGGMTWLPVIPIPQPEEDK